MNKMNVVITDIETYLPSGNGFEEFSEKIQNTERVPTQNIQFADGVDLVHKTDETYLENHFPARFRKKEISFPYSR